MNPKRTATIGKTQYPNEACKASSLIIAKIKTNQFTEINIPDKTSNNISCLFLKTFNKELLSFKKKQITTKKKEDHIIR